MTNFSKFFSTVLIIAALAAPVSALALVPGISFGGRIINLFPCLNGTIYTQIISANTATFGAIIPYIWTPATITKLVGPPNHIGQQILGLASPTFTPLCVISFTPFVAIPGFPMIDEVGTSAI